MTKSVKPQYPKFQKLPEAEVEAMPREQMIDYYRAFVKWYFLGDRKSETEYEKYKAPNAGAMELWKNGHDVVITHINTEHECLFFVPLAYRSPEMTMAHPIHFITHAHLFDKTKTEYRFIENIVKKDGLNEFQQKYFGRELVQPDAEFLKKFAPGTPVSVSGEIWGIEGRFSGLVQPAKGEEGQIFINAPKAAGVVNGSGDGIISLTPAFLKAFTDEGLIKTA